MVSTGSSRPADGSEPERFTYGEDPSQWADLYRPAGDPAGSRGVVVVVHGGFWKAAYDASLGAPLAADLSARGWTAWNLEYRRVGNGGGSPTTFDDVAAGIDLLADVEGLDLDSVITLGHSAGGHLAAWAAARGRFERWRDERVPVTGVVSQAGVLDLTRAAADGLGGGAVEAFLGEPPGPSYDEVDPRRQIPLEVPLRCVHGRSDTNVPAVAVRDATSWLLAPPARTPSSSRSTATTSCSSIPSSSVWEATVDLLEELGGAAR